MILGGIKMDDLNIYVSDDSELAEYEATSRGYRTDVFIRVNNNIHNVRVYSMIRLQQDFETEIDSYGFYSIEPNLVLVKDVSKEEIIATIKKLYEQKYFEELKAGININLKELVLIY
jgi:threonine synthase